MLSVEKMILMNVSSKSFVFRSVILIVGILAWTTLTARGQSYINQQEVEEVLTTYRSDDLDALPEVYYDYHILKDSSGNSVFAKNRFYVMLGNGDEKLGHRRSKLVELLNRRLMEEIKIGDTLIVPQQFELDFRAYTPFPLYYPGARNFDKLFIIHKSIQAFAAYEYGKLVRWGIVNTGSEESRTPNGRFNFNWKVPYRISTLSPEDEPWEMYWVFNFNNIRGIHVHQYAMPTGGPTSHGCVRLVEIDAKWIYDWATPWKTNKGFGEESMQAKVLELGTIVLVLGEDPVGLPHPFEFKRRFPVLTKVQLPDNPYDVPPGTDLQKAFDKKMNLKASR